MSASTTGWIVLTHTHTGFPRLDDAGILDALPDDMRNGPRERARIEGTGELSNLMRVDWDALQREQAEQFQTRLAPLHGSGHGIAYFGRVYIPLAFDLGYRVENWVKTEIFQYHRHDKSWRWPGRPAEHAAPEVFTEHNLPGKPSRSDGPVSVRVSVTTRIAESDAIDRVGNPAADIEIHLGSRCGVDALRSAEELEAVARAFEKALYDVHTYLPQAGPIHLFAAVPVGLAFRMGTLINHTVHPPIQTYQFVNNAPIKYQRALMAGERIQPDMKLKIQFLTAEPDGTRRLRLDREHCEIAARLHDGERRDKFELVEPRLAVRINDLLTYIRRAAAHIVHFSSHGEPGGYLLLENRAGTTERVAPESLRLLFDVWNEDQHLRCVMINACHSHALAKVLTSEPAVVPCAIGTTQEVSDRAAICFAEGFYGTLADGHTLRKSFQSGQVAVKLECPNEADHFCLEVADPAMLDKPLFAA